MNSLIYGPKELVKAIEKKYILLYYEDKNIYDFDINKE